jgi:hypothetical protein
MLQVSLLSVIEPVRFRRNQASEAPPSGHLTRPQALPALAALATAGRDLAGEGPSFGER